MPTINIRWADNTKQLAQNLKEGLNQIEATKSAAEKMAQALGGDRLIRAAHNYVAAVQQLGGAQKLTADKQAQVNAVLTKALEQYKALGKEAPAAMKELAAATKQVEQPTSGLTTKIVALGAAIGTFLGNAAYDLLKRVGSGLLDIASNGIKLAPTVGAFNSLTRAIGETSDAMLRAGRTATKGLISDLDLMQAANKGLLLGLPITSQSFGTLAQTAVVLGKAMGQGPVKSFDDLITALGRSSPMILDNLGLSVKVGEANDKYAASVGKTAESLTDAEKKLAFYNAAMDAAKRKVEEVGGLNLTLADRVTQAKVAFTNFTDALGVAIATSPVLNAAFGGIADAAQAAFGENQTVMVQRLSKVVNTLAIGVVDMAQVGVTAASVLSRAWSALQFIFSGTASVITSVGLAFYKLVAATYEVAEHIPALGGHFSKAARAARDMATWMGGVQQSFHDQAESALNGVKGNSAFAQTLDSVSQSLTDMRGRMVAASSATVDAAVIAEQLTRAHGDTADAATTVAKAEEKVAKAVENVASAALKFGTFVRRDIQQPIVSALPTVTQLSDALEELSEAPILQGKLPKLTSGAWIEALLPKGLGTAIKNGLSGVLQGIPQTIANAFTGGGGIAGAAKSIASQLGSTIGDTIGKTIGLLGKFGGPIGAAIGSLAGPLIGLFGKLFSNPEKQINPIRQAFVDAAGGLDALNRRAAAAGVTLRAMLDAKNPKEYEAAIRDLNAALEFQDNAMRTLEETAQKYGFTLSELGPAFSRQKLDERAQELFRDFKVLTSAGIGVDTVLGRMGESINAFIADALKTGTEIPAAMAPMIQRMVELGQLTDENGNVITDLETAGVKFSMTMSEGFQALIGEVQKLTDAIARGLGVAIENIPNPEVEGTVRWHVEPPPAFDMPEIAYPHRGGRVGAGGVQYFAGGGMPQLPAFQPMGTDTVPAMLTPGEMVLNASQQRAVGALVAQATGKLGGSGPVSVTFGDIRIEATGADLADIEAFAPKFNEGVRRNAGGMLTVIETVAKRAVGGA